MQEQEKIFIEKPTGHRCFACGTDNPIGLNLQFYCLGDEVCSDISLGANYAGWENMVHGGIISALLDEVMSWAIMYHKKTFLVTRKMSIKYIRPVPVETLLTAKGKVVDDSHPPKIMANAEIRDSKGRLLVRGTAEFVAVSRDGLEMVPEWDKAVIGSLFQRF